MFDIVEHTDLPIITAQDFLPKAVVGELFGELESIQGAFGQPQWSESGKNVSNQSHAHTLCNGKDIWLPERGVHAPVLTEKLLQFLFHQGMLEFTSVRLRIE